MIQHSAWAKRYDAKTFIELLAHSRYRKREREREIFKTSFLPSKHAVLCDVFCCDFCKSFVMTVLGCNGLRCVINVILSVQGSISKDNTVYFKMTQIFERAFWRSLVDDLMEEPPVYTRVLSVLCEARDGIKVTAPFVIIDGCAILLLK